MELDAQLALSLGIAFAVKAYEAVAGTNVMDVAALAVVANDAETLSEPGAHDADVAYEADVGVKVMLVAALAVVANELLMTPVIAAPEPLNPADAVPFQFAHHLELVNEIAK